MSNKVYAGTVGVAFVLETGCDDLADADSVAILYQKPNGTTGQWTGEVYQTTKVRHVTTAGEIGISDYGTWHFMSHVENLGDYTGPGDTVRYPIYARFK